jgi:hypothetical protein
MVSFNYHTKITPRNANTASATGSEYNAGLKQRGSLTFWVDESVLENWALLNESMNQAGTGTSLNLR